MGYYNVRKKKNQWLSSPLMLLIYRLLAVTLLFSFTRWMLYLFNMQFFPNLHLGKSMRLYGCGLRFDMVVLSYINIPVILYYTLPFKKLHNKLLQTLIDIYFVIVNSIAIILNLIDTIYFRFIGKRMTSELFQFFGDGDENATGIVWQLVIDYWYMFLFGILAILMLVVVAKITRVRFGQTDETKGWYLKQSLSLIVLAALTVIGCRGGTQHKPIGMIKALEYAEPHHVPIVLNTPFTIAKGANSQILEHMQLVEDVYDPIVSIKAPVRYIKSEETPNDTIHDNLVLIILESFGQEMIGYYNPEHSNRITPFLDSLLSQSLTFDGRANGRRSIESLPSILSGLPSLMDVDLPTSPYFDNDLEGFGIILKEHGYNTSMFHGGNNGTMNFDIFAQQVGFDHYYGRDEYNNDGDYDGKWGIFDGPFLQYFAKTLDSIPRPFASLVYTLSSHHPFTLPKGFKLPKESYNWSGFERTVYYTDCALRDFFKTAAQKPWFENTLFIITSDHANTEHYDHNFNNIWGMYAIPIAFYQPNKITPERSNEMAQQIDLGTSILSALHLNDTVFSFGRNLFDTLQAPSWISYINQTYQYSDGNYLIQSDGKNVIGVFNLKNDSLLDNNLINHIQCPDLLLKFQAQLQEYNNRMIENRLTHEQTNDTIHH